MKNEKRKTRKKAGKGKKKEKMLKSTSKFEINEYQKQIKYSTSSLDIDNMAPFDATTAQ